MIDPRHSTGALRMLAAIALLLLGSPTLAHKPSDSYLHLTPNAEGFTGEWRIALRDLEAELGIDDDGNRQITWGELKSHHDAIAAYALSRLAIAADESRCRIEAGAQLVDKLSDGAYTMLPLQVHCAAGAARWTLKYELLFDADPTHRGLVTLDSGARPQTLVLLAQHNEVVLPMR